ncbi:hypothetical protein ACQW02_00015 [Humitalea sp. 24SJ18S-53]|uniref:hypothetical protein n=1 Tax=Humitalea sp. 24SJ18S-53 TaxID=3422307 RepID=UPI003D67AB79
MPFADPHPAASDLGAFLTLCGRRHWTARLAMLNSRAAAKSQSGRATQQRHALELTLARMADPAVFAKATRAERRILAFAREAAKLAATLAPEPRARLVAQLRAGLSDESTLIPLFHVLRVAAMQRARGFAVHFAGLADDSPHDLIISKDGQEVEVVCETVSADEGRPVHRGDWCALVDMVNPDLRTWLAAHPGRYLLKMTLPEGLQGPERLSALYGRISGMLAAQKRQDASSDAVMKLDPLMLAGAQAGLPAHLRANFGPEAHLAVTGDASGGSVFVMAARAGQENAIAQAVTRRMAAAAAGRLTGLRPGIVAVFLDDLERAEWRALRETLELEGAARRFLTDPAAKPVLALTCTSRMEFLGLAPPDAVEGGELRFRNQAHPAAKNLSLMPAIASSV